MFLEFRVGLESRVRSVVSADGSSWRHAGGATAHFTRVLYIEMHFQKCVFTPRVYFPPFDVHNANICCPSTGRVDAHRERELPPLRFVLLRLSRQRLFHSLNKNKLFFFPKKTNYFFQLSGRLAVQTHILKRPDVTAVCWLQVSFWFSLSAHCILRIDGQVNGFGLLDLRCSVLNHNSESF